MAPSVYQLSFLHFCSELETVTEKVKGCLDRIDTLLKEDESQEQLVQVKSLQHVRPITFSNCSTPVQEKLGPRPASNVATEIRTEWKQYLDAYTKGVCL